MTTAPRRLDQLRPFRSLRDVLAPAASPAAEGHLHYDRSARVWRRHSAVHAATASPVQPCGAAEQVAA